MSRLHPMFPAGWPGIGLLFLRTALAVTLIVQAAAYLSQFPELKFQALATSLLLLGSGLALLMGVFTSIFSAIAALSSLAMTFSWLPSPSYSFFSGNPLALDVVLMAAACGCLGAGAFSVDAQLFGRRKIVIPVSTESSAITVPLPGSRSGSGITRP